MSAAALPSTSGAAMFAGRPQPKRSAHPSLLAAQTAANATVSASGMSRNTAIRMMEIMWAWLAKMARRIFGSNGVAPEDAAQQDQAVSQANSSPEAGPSSINKLVDEPESTADNYMSQAAGAKDSAASQANDDLKYHAQWILDALAVAVANQSYITEQTPGNEAVDQAQILLHQIKSALEFYAGKKANETAATRAAIKPLADSISTTPDMVLGLIRKGLIPAEDPRITAAASHLQRLDALDREIAATSLCFDSFLDMAEEHPDKRIQALATSYMTAVRQHYQPADQRKSHAKQAPAPAQPINTASQTKKSPPISRPPPQTTPWVSPAQSAPEKEIALPPEKPATTTMGEQAHKSAPKSSTMHSTLPGAVSMASMRRFAMTSGGNNFSSIYREEQPPEIEDPNDSSSPSPS